MYLLGLLVGKDGIRVNPKKVKILRTWPNPNYITDIWIFLGLLQFFRRFIPTFSNICGQLTDLTKKNGGIRKYDENCESALRNSK